MKPSEIEQLAREQMAHYGLVGWTLGPWLKSVYILGQTDYETKTIVFSRVLLPIQPDWVVWDTILHEISHVLAGPGVEGHGAEWKKLAVELNVMPYASNPYTVDPPSPWVLQCVGCWESYPRWRVTNKVRTHCGEPMEWVRSEDLDQA